MMRIGELTEGPGRHAVKTSNIHMGNNKNKIKVVLYTSKTHGKASYPQKIKIQAAENYYSRIVSKNRIFCPFKLVNDYLKARGGYVTPHDNLFVFRDGYLVFPHHVRHTLRTCLDNLGLEGNLYDCHSFRIGRTCDLAKDNVPFQKICSAGCWRSNAVYRYLRQ